MSKVSEVTRSRCGGDAAGNFFASLTPCWLMVYSLRFTIDSTWMCSGALGAKLSQSIHRNRGSLTLLCSAVLCSAVLCVCMYIPTLSVSFICSQTVTTIILLTDVYIHAAPWTTAQNKAGRRRNARERIKRVQQRSKVQRRESSSLLVGKNFVSQVDDR